MAVVLLLEMFASAIAVEVAFAYIQGNRGASMQQQTRAIVLRRTAYRDADWILTLFCRERGTFGAIAPRARSSRRRFGGALEPGSIVDARFVERRNAQLVRLEEAHAVLPVIGAMRTLERIGGLMRALALARAFLQEQEPNSQKFDLLEWHLRALSDRDPSPAELMMFELHWLARSGFAPCLERCVACGAQPPAFSESPNPSHSRTWIFDFTQGGFVCVSCAHPTAHGVPVSQAVAIALQQLARGEIPAHEEACLAAGAAIERYIDYTLGKPLRVPQRIAPGGEWFVS